MQSLEKRFAKGLGWGLIDNFSGTGINFLVGILLARQLTPEIFGIRRRFFGIGEYLYNHC